MSTPSAKTSSGATRRKNALLGFGHILRLVVWLGPFALATFGGVAAGALELRLFRLADWIYDRAEIDAARRWKDGILDR